MTQDKRQKGERMERIRVGTLRKLVRNIMDFGYGLEGMSDDVSLETRDRAEVNTLYYILESRGEGITRRAIYHWDYVNKAYLLSFYFWPNTYFVIPENLVSNDLKLKKERMERYKADIEKHGPYLSKPGSTF